jgi:hypothetical protein
MPHAFGLHEKAFDICNVCMTITVIALSVLFFLSFQQTAPAVQQWKSTFKRKTPKVWGVVVALKRFILV